MHGDYWNRLGWNDPFSDRQFSERQQSYAPDEVRRWVALTRRASGNHVPRGENEGRDLQHARVRVTAFVQDPSTMKVIGAARTSAG